MMVPRPEEQDKLKIIHKDPNQKMPECQGCGKAKLPKVLAMLTNPECCKSGDKTQLSAI